MDKQYIVANCGSTYRVFPEGEMTAKGVNHTWDKVHGPCGLEEAKENCVEELQSQVTAAESEIEEAENYEG